MTRLAMTFGRALLVLWAVLASTIGAVPMQFTPAPAATEPEKTESRSFIPTFREHGEVVLDLREERGVRGIERERSRWRFHISRAAFIDRLITEITTRDIRTWVREMERKDAVVVGKQAPRKLSDATISRCFSLVSVIFTDALENEIVAANPCSVVRLKKRVSEGDTVEVWSYLSADEQRLIFECPTVPLEQKLVIQFAWGTGLRAGEQFNLELPDLIVTGPNPRVIVRYSNRYKGKKSPPKSGKRREVPLMGATLDVARQWLSMLPAFAPNNPHNLVFPTPNGAYRQQGKPLGRSESIHDVYDAAGIAPRKGLHWHALRHTFDSNLIAGVHGRPLRIEVVQRLLGHSSVQVTERYAHLGQDEVVRAIREAELVPMAEETERDLSMHADPSDTVRDLDAVARGAA